MALTLLLHNVQFVSAFVLIFSLIFQDRPFHILPDQSLFEDRFVSIKSDLGVKYIQNIYNNITF